MARKHTPREQSAPKAIRLYVTPELYWRLCDRADVELRSLSNQARIYIERGLDEQPGATLAKSA